MFLLCMGSVQISISYSLLSWIDENICRNSTHRRQMSIKFLRFQHQPEHVKKHRGALHFVSNFPEYVSVFLPRYYHLCRADISADDVEQEVKRLSLHSESSLKGMITDIVRYLFKCSPGNSSHFKTSFNLLFYISNSHIPSTT